jgi:hypothetical protein
MELGCPAGLSSSAAEDLLESRSALHKDSAHENPHKTPVPFGSGRARSHSATTGRPTPQSTQGSHANGVTIPKIDKIGIYYTSQTKHRGQISSYTESNLLAASKMER